MIVEQLKHEMNKSDEMKSCIDIMNDILIILTRNDVVSWGTFCTCTRFSWIFCRLLKLLSSQIRVKRREVESGDGAVVRALASHRSSLGSIPRRGVTCGLLVLLDLVPRLFFREIPNSVLRCCSFCLISREPKHFSSCYSELGLYKYRTSSTLNSVSPLCTLSYHLAEAWWAFVFDTIITFRLSVQGSTHDDVLLLATSLLRDVVKAVIMMDRSLAVVVGIFVLLPDGIRAFSNFASQRSMIA